MILIFLMSILLPIRSEIVTRNSSLVIIGMQRCYAEGGSLKLNKKNMLLSPINHIIQSNRNNLHSIVYTVDSYVSHHISFASQHHNLQAFDQTTLSYNADGVLCESSSVRNKSRIRNCSCSRFLNVKQTVWPDHCIQNTLDSEILFGLDISVEKDFKLLKGTFSDLGAYSVFYSNGQLKKSGLDKHLRSQNISKIILTGFSFDHNLKNTALDAILLGYEVYIVEDAVETMSDLTSIKDLISKGVKTIKSRNIINLFQPESMSYMYIIIIVIAVAVMMSCCIGAGVFLIFFRKFKYN